MRGTLSVASEDSATNRDKAISQSYEDPEATPGRGVIYAYNSGPVRPRDADVDSLQIGMLQTFNGHANWRSRASNLLCCFASGGLYVNGSGDGANASLKSGEWERIDDAPLLGSVRPSKMGKMSLVLDLDETMVHSSFTPVDNADFIVPVEVDGTIMQVYVLKRPWLDYFLDQVAHHFEVVIFTASLAKYADAVLDRLDKGGLFDYRLYRGSCVMYAGGYVKDLSRLGRPLENVLLVDNSAHSYAFQPENGLPSATWISDPDDRGLLAILNVLLRIRSAEDVRLALPHACVAEGYCNAALQLA